MASAIQCIFSAFICANISAAAVGPFACASFDDVWPARLAFASAYALPPTAPFPRSWSPALGDDYGGYVSSY